QTYPLPSRFFLSRDMRPSGPANPPVPSRFSGPESTWAPPQASSEPLTRHPPRRGFVRALGGSDSLHDLLDGLAFSLAHALAGQAEETLLVGLRDPLREV